MPLLVIVRHGQSVWNLQNNFTGEIDVELTDEGRREAHVAGKDLSAISFDCGFTSVLKRAEETLDIILEEIHQQNIPIIRDKALNERNYGDLQGLNKAAIAEKYGEKQVAIWRRSYDVRPPGGESRKDTSERVLPFYRKNVEPPFTRRKKYFNCSSRKQFACADDVPREHFAGSYSGHFDLPTASPRMYTLTKELKLLRIAIFKEVNL